MNHSLTQFCEVMAGRQKKSSVWNYFKYEKDSDKSVCQVRISKNEEEVEWNVCLQHEEHLKLQHKEAFKKFEEEENERSKSSV